MGAILYSLVETAKANGLVVYDYISRCLQHITEQPNNLDALLPWNIELLSPSRKLIELNTDDKGKQVFELSEKAVLFCRAVSQYFRL